MKAKIKASIAMNSIVAGLQLFLFLQHALCAFIGNKFTGHSYTDGSGRLLDRKDLIKFNSSLAQTEISQKNNVGEELDYTTAIVITVSKSKRARGHFIRVQDAIDAVPHNNGRLFVIRIEPGIYREKITIPADKPYIILSGSGSQRTIITWNDSAKQSGTFYCATVTVFASDFVARLLSIENSYGPGDQGPGDQAVALRVSGDRAAFYGVKIVGYQDTILDDSGRHYFKDCYIEGATDFICGDARSLYESCHLNLIPSLNGAVTAQRRSSPMENTGFVFLRCKITGRGLSYLGRPWGRYSLVIFAHSYMANVIFPEGWSDWNNQENEKTVYYGQYQCAGPGANARGRVPWSYELTDAQARPFLGVEFIDGQKWLRPMPSRLRRAGKLLALQN